jgi:hypothetical protein
MSCLIPCTCTCTCSKAFKNPPACKIAGLRGGGQTCLTTSVLTLSSVAISGPAQPQPGSACLELSQDRALVLMDGTVLVLTLILLASQLPWEITLVKGSQACNTIILISILFHSSLILLCLQFSHCGKCRCILVLAWQEVQMLTILVCVS